jgi:hypothetical protein
MRQVKVSRMQPRYWEALRIGWRILWQGVGSVMVLLFILNLLLLTWLPELPRTTPSLWAWSLPLLVASVIALFVFMPLVVRSLLTKPFRGFRLCIVRESADPLRTQDPDHHPSSFEQPSYSSASSHVPRLPKAGPMVNG